RSTRSLRPIGSSATWRRSFGTQMGHSAGTTSATTTCSSTRRVYQASSPTTGSTPKSPRALAAVGPALAVGYHALYERGGSAVDRLPGGPRWRESVESARPSARHLEIHE